MSLLYQKLVPTPLDNFHTPTSQEQVEVESTIQEYIEAYQSSLQQGPIDDEQDPKSQQILSEDKVPIPVLNKAYHLAFARRVLEPLPSPYVGFDSTRCWLVYWIAHTHALLGSELDERLRTHAIATLIQFQNPTTGGFGGGNGQVAHLMGTYASVMALALVGGPGVCPDEDDVALGLSVQIGKGGWDSIDRSKMYSFLLSLKQPDGAFTVHKDGEIDVRATYCVVCIALILGIATPELFEGLGQAVANCQTYEGGLSAASHPFRSATGISEEAATLGEAHGGYTFCAMAAHLALSLVPNPASPNQSPFTSTQGASLSNTTWQQMSSASSDKLDLDGVVRWAAQQQGIPIEGGGFRGRTNKLVDGCYGWFSGAGLGTVLAAQLDLRHGQWWVDDRAQDDEHVADDNNEDWESVSANAASTSNADEQSDDGCLFDRRALQEYILAVAQAPRGGLRDKPGKNADVYHTCYNLSGLSLCQHRVQLDQSVRQTLLTSWKAHPTQPGQAPFDDWRKACFASILGWSIDPEYTSVLGSRDNRVGVTHPIFNVPLAKAKTMMQWAYNQ